MVDSTRAAAFATPVFSVPNPNMLTDNITTATTTLVKTGAGTFVGITVNTGGAGSIAKVYDGVDATGKLLGTFSTATQGAVNIPGGGYPLAVGLCVVTSGGTPADITVAYEQAMPLTAKGEEILAAMKKEYGGDKGEEVFYASRNKGTVTAVDSAARADMSPSSFDQMRKLFDEWIEEEKSEPQHREDSRTDGEILMDSLHILRGRMAVAAASK